MGRKGARERAPFSPSGGNGSKRTLRSFVAPHRPSPSGLRGERSRSGINELSPPGGSEGYGACGMGPPQKPSEAGFAGKGAAAEWMSFRQGRKRRIWSLRSFVAPRRPSPSGLRGERRRNGMNELSPRVEAKDMEFAPTPSRFTPSATVAFPSSPGRSGRALPALGSAHRSGPGSLLQGVQRFSLSRFGAGAWPGRFHSDSGKIQICCADLGFLPSLRSKRPYAPTLRASSRTVPRWSSR